MEIKVPFYNIINIFLPGLVLLGAVVLLFLDKVKVLVQEITDIGSAGLEVLVTVSLFAIAYEAGYIIFRIGSIVIEPILKKLFVWTEYSDFIAAKKSSDKAHDKLETLSREYAYSRTHITLFLILIILSGVRSLWWIAFLCVLILALFIVTVRGHMKRIQKIVKQYNPLS
ncbi:MAG: hypothetical protein LBM93_14165 [Oscillospiraceae bacterium]|jgi:hypothetical protein|nr:hypothetical protein [Oscillospiraceae bacterium]